MADEKTAEHLAAEEVLKEAEAKLAELKRKAAHKEFPKFVEPHKSHIVMHGDHVSVPHFPEHHVDRDGKVTVRVDDEEHEAKALAAKETK